MRKSARPFTVVILCFFLLTSSYPQPPAAHPVARWIQSAVVYEVNPRTFSKSGNFRGIQDRLDSLKDLGVTVLWLMPIHPVGQVKKKGSLGSPYAVQDYYGINPAYGTRADLKHLVAAAHQRGIKVIIDMVANHTAWDSVLIEQHPEWFKHDAQGNILPPVPEWSDVAGLDYGNPQLRAYMIQMLKYWLQDFALDGFRCDVAGEIPTDFWEHARAALTKINPDIILIAEANKPELLVQAFDLDYAWPFHSTLTEVLENGKPATALADNWTKEHDRYPKGALEMRFSDNHDEKRAIARFGERGALAASAIVFTMDGVPMLYNGMEVGDTTESGAPALFEDLPVFWPISERRSNYLPFYKQLIALREAHPALQQGDTEWVRNSDMEDVITYFRRGGGEQFLIAVNTSNKPFTGVLDVPVGTYVDMTPGAKKGTVSLPAISLGAFEYRIYQKAQSDQQVQSTPHDD